MLGNDPNMPLSVLYGLGRWEAGGSGGGMDPQGSGLVMVGEEGGESGSGSKQSRSSSSSSIGSSSGATAAPQNPPPPKALKKPKKPRQFESSEEEAQPPAPHPKLKSKPNPPPPNPSPPPLANRGRDPYGNVPGVGDTRYVPWAEGGNWATVSQVTVLGDWDEEVDPGDWWEVSQGSTGEGFRFRFKMTRPRLYHSRRGTQKTRASQPPQVGLLGPAWKGQSGRPVAAPAPAGADTCRVSGGGGGGSAFGEG